MAVDLGKFVSDPVAFERSVEVFKRFDCDGDGRISKQELARIFISMDPDRWDEKRITLLMDVADTNGDGWIQYEEFVRWLLQPNDREWDVDRGAAQLKGQALFPKGSLVRDRRATTRRTERLVMQVDQRSGAGKLGVEVDGSDGRTLEIKKIKEGGAVAKWNIDNTCQQVALGDRIVDVNGVNSNVKRMMKELTKRLVIDITVDPGESSVCFVDKLADVYLVDSGELDIGQFSVIRKATHRETKVQFVVKSLHKKTTARSVLLDMSALMKEFDHPNILRLYDVFEDCIDFHLVTEFCTGGQLLERILADNCFPERQAVRVMRQVFAAVGYLHSLAICHRDIRPEHILLKSNVPTMNAIIKLVDFRAARPFTEKSVFRTQVMPAAYMPPEMAKRMGYNQSCDMWCCGVLMYLALSGYPPYLGDDDAETLVLVQRAALRFPDDWFHVSKDAKDLILELLESVPRRRCTASQAIRHRWIEGSHQNGIDFPLHKGQQNMRAFCGQNKLKKAALHAIAQRLNDDEIRELQDMFALLDTNGDKMVTFYELKAGLDRLGKEESISSLQRLMEEVDVDGSKRIDYTEFLAATIDARRKFEEGTCWAAFRVFDRDGSGSISREELADVLCNDGLKAAMGDESVTRVLRECDTNKDGRIDFKEFMAMLRRGPPAPIEEI